MFLLQGFGVANALEFILRKAFGLQDVGDVCRIYLFSMARFWTGFWPSLLPANLPESLGARLVDHQTSAPSGQGLNPKWHTSIALL